MIVITAKILLDGEEMRRPKLGSVTLWALF